MPAKIDPYPKLMDWPENSAFNLAKLRESIFLNKAQFARLVGANYQTYVLWENGKSPIPQTAWIGIVLQARRVKREQAF